MSNLAATFRASSESADVQHPVSGISPLGPSQSFIVTPITSCPCDFKSPATTEESTPPLIATKTLMTVPLLSF